MSGADLLDRARRLRGDRTPFVLATVVRAQRPTSAKAGDRAIVLPDGTLDGFVGGSCAESTVRLEGLRLLETGESTLLRITPDAPAKTPDPPGGAAGGLVGGLAGGTARAGPDDSGLITVANPCLSGGTLEIFMEAVLPPPLVHVLGDAPVAQALADLGAAIGYDVRTTTDPHAPIRPDTGAVVVASHGRDEPPVLTAALRAGVPYVALVASRRRGQAVLAALACGEEQKARVHSPAGLDIGARTAGEVALSILAEIVANRPLVAQPATPAGQVPGGGDHQAGAARPGGPAGAPPASAVDPVCGMSVAVTASAAQLAHAGQTWYFCCSGCRDTAAAAPDRYLVGS